MESIAIIHGGNCSEKEISYQTSKNLQSAMKAIGKNFVLLEADQHLTANLLTKKITKALLAVHGQYAEDGTLQGLLEYLKIPYTGSGVLASSVCMDKIIFKNFIKTLNILTPEYCFVTKGCKHKASDFLKSAGLPLVVKPSRGGSSLATFIVKTEEQYLPAIKEALKKDSRVLIEKYIEGKDLSISFFADRFLSPIEITVKQGFYDYKNKYTAGCTDYKILPKPESGHFLDQAQNQVQEIINFLGIRHYARADFMLDKNNHMYLLEINTLPGFTNSSLIIKAGQQDNLNTESMLRFLLDKACLDY